MISTENTGDLATLRSAIRRAKFTDEESLIATLLDAAPYDDELAGRIGNDAAARITGRASVEGRRTPQSTHPDAVREALADVRAWIGKERP